ncbi:MAG: hypothetical protein FWG66_12365 [Spirochaetes bacterium]|nr:hypothetical protein [Spirochaetota bacterium]
MKTFVKLLGIVVITTTIGFSMIGCATTMVEVEPPVTAMLQPISRDFTILGIVQFERSDRFAVSYSELLDEARSLFPAANAVVDVRIEPVVRTGAFGGRSQVFLVSGIAIQYVLQPETTSSSAATAQ